MRITVVSDLVRGRGDRAHNVGVIPRERSLNEERGDDVDAPREAQASRERFPRCGGRGLLR